MLNSKVIESVLIKLLLSLWTKPHGVALCTVTNWTHRSLATAGLTGRYASCTAICSSCSQRFYTEDLSPRPSFALSQLETTDKALQGCKFGAMLCCLPIAGSCLNFYYCVLWPLGHIAEGVVKIHHRQNKW